jgi:hypothetical protein
MIAMRTGHSCQEEWPDERINQVVVGIMRKRGLN